MSDEGIKKPSAGGLLAQLAGLAVPALGVWGARMTAKDWVWPSVWVWYGYGTIAVALLLSYLVKMYEWRQEAADRAKRKAEAEQKAAREQREAEQKAWLNEEVECQFPTCVTRLPRRAMEQECVNGTTIAWVCPLHRTKTI